MPKATDASGVCLIAPMRACTARTRARGSGSATGRDRYTNPKRFPSWWSGFAPPRRSTGTNARTSRAGSPRCDNQLLRAPATAATSTSFTVAPHIRPRALIGGSGSAADHATRLTTPSGPFRALATSRGLSTSFRSAATAAGPR